MQDKYESRTKGRKAEMRMYEELSKTYAVKDVASDGYHADMIASNGKVNVLIDCKNYR